LYGVYRRLLMIAPWLSSKDTEENHEEFRVTDGGTAGVELLCSEDKPRALNTLTGCT